MGEVRKGWDLGASTAPQSTRPAGGINWGEPSSFVDFLGYGKLKIGRPVFCKAKLHEPLIAGDGSYVLNQSEMDFFRRSGS